MDGPPALVDDQRRSHWAALMGWDDIGSLTPGYRADITIVDRDPATCELDALKETQVPRTVLGGRAVYDNGTLKET